MLINKCDICKNVIKDNDDKVSARINNIGKDGFFHNSFDFCGKCGKIIKDFLVNKKLVKISNKIKV